MKRRDFLKVSAAGAAATAVASPAIAQSSPEIKWRMTSSFPKSLDTIYGGAEYFAKHVAEMTDNKFQIQVLPGWRNRSGTAGARRDLQEHRRDVPHRFVLLCRQGSDLCHLCVGAVRPQCAQQNSWWYQGGGMELGNEFFKKFDVIGFPCGNTGTQMGGWFRKEIKTVADLSGLKFRIGGIAGQVLQKVGVVPQQLAGGDIYPSLEKGTIDAAEWVGPYDDEKLGFQKVAKYYYYPGFWEGGPTVHAFCNLEKWNSLPKNYQSIVANACAERQHLDGGALRHAKPLGIETSGRGRHPASALHERSAGSLPEGDQRIVGRDFRQEPRLQEIDRCDAGLSLRPVSVVAGCGIHLRQLHDPLAHARLNLRV